MSFRDEINKYLSKYLFRIELQRKNVIINYLHSQLSLKVTDNALCLMQNSYSTAAAISKHKNSTIRSSKQQSSKSQIKQKILVAGDSMLNNIRKRGLSKQHTVKVKIFPDTTTETIFGKLKNLLESKPDMLMIHASTNDLPKNITLREKCLYSEFFWSECRKMRTRKTPKMDIFHPV